jgi:hypothetical protein
MEDSRKKALVQVVFACLHSAKKKLKLELVFADGSFRVGDQIYMPHEIAAMVLPHARRSLDTKDDLTADICEIVVQIQAKGFDESKVFEAGPLPTVPLLPSRGALPTFEGCFSPRMHAYIMARSVEKGVLPDGIVGTVLAACSAALPAQCKLRIGSTYSEHPTVWVALVGMCSTKKTPTLKTVLGFFEKKQSQFGLDNKAAEKAHKKSMLRYEVELADFRKNAAKNKSLVAPEEPEKPAQKDIYLSDATIEALLQSCAGNPRGVLYFRDEMSAWLGQLTRRDAEKERAQWLEGYNAGRHEQARIGRGRIEIECFRTIVFGGLQPSIVEKMLQDDVIDGLAARFILVRHDNNGHATNAIDPAHLGYIENILEKLFQTGECEVSFNPAALTLFEATCRQYSSELEGMPNTHWRAFLGKRPGLLARLILVWHAVERAEEGTLPHASPVEAATVQRVARFVEMFLRRSSALIYGQAGVQIPEAGEGISFNSQEKMVIRWLKEQVKKGRQKISSREVLTGSRSFQEMRRKRTDVPFLEALAASGLAAVVAEERGRVSLVLSAYLAEWEEA